MADTLEAGKASGTTLRTVRLREFVTVNAEIVTVVGELASATLIAIGWGVSKQAYIESGLEDRELRPLQACLIPGPSLLDVTPPRALD